VYPGRVGFKNNLSATIDCNQSFESIDYKDICGCTFNGRGIIPSTTSSPIVPPIICINTLSGGDSNTFAYIIYDGNCYSSCNIFSGGNSSTSINCPNSVIQEIIYSGGSSSTNSMNILSGNL
jgi:hypothetical protein